MRIMVMSILCALFVSSPIMADDNSNGHFCRLDTNRDNTISKQEFLDGEVAVDRQKAVKLFPDMRDEGQQEEGTLKESLFGRMDTNGDGLLSTDEWHQLAPNVLAVHF